MLFSKADLRRLIIPLVLEQFLAVTIGMAAQRPSTSRPVRTAAMEPPISTQVASTRASA